MEGKECSMCSGEWCETHELEFCDCYIEERHGDRECLAWVAEGPETVQTIWGEMVIGGEG